MYHGSEVLEDLVYVPDVVEVLQSLLLLQHHLGTAGCHHVGQVPRLPVSCSGPQCRSDRTIPLQEAPEVEVCTYSFRLSHSPLEMK